MKKKLDQRLLYFISRWIVIIFNVWIIFSVMMGFEINKDYFINYYLIVLVLHFIVCIGISFPFFELMSFTYVLQILACNYWLINLKFPYYIIKNPVQDFYPVNLLYIAIFSLTTTLLIDHIKFKTKIIRIIDWLSNNPYLNKLAFTLFMTGVVFSMVNLFLPALPTIRQISNYLSDLTYISALLYIISRHRAKWIYVSILFLFLVINAMKTTFFFPLFCWSFFYFLIFQLKYPWKLPVKLALFSFFAILIVIIQAAKTQTRREKVVYGTAFDRFSDLMLEYGSHLQNNDDKVRKVYLPTLLIRLNQGILDHRVFKKFPSYYFEKRPNTILMGLLGSFVPRIFWAEKPKFDNSRLNELAGANVTKAFMTISIIAEAYANFGKVGGGIFMMVFALVLSLVFRFIINYSYRKLPYLIFFIPLIFFIVIRIEIDFTQIAYGIVSSGVFIVLLLYILRERKLLDMITTRPAFLYKN